MRRLRFRKIRIQSVSAKSWLQLEMMQNAGSRQQAQLPSAQAADEIRLAYPPNKESAEQIWEGRRRREEGGFSLGAEAGACYAALAEVKARLS